MKEARKTNNIVIRDASKKGSREELHNKTKTSFTINEKKRSSKIEAIQTQKQLTRAQNLNEEQQMKINKEAVKVVSKKVKKTQTKIENDMVTFLETECNRLGLELQKQKFESEKHKKEIEYLRKNMSFLNQKLEKIYKDHESLNKNNNYGQMEKQQLREELQKIKTALKRKQDQFQYMESVKNKEICDLKEQIKSQQETICKITKLKQQFELKCQELQEEVEEKKMEAQYIRENFEQRKKEWDRFRQQTQIQNKVNLEKKGEKISKYQGEVQTLQDRLKDQDAIKKKLNEKNKDYERQILKKNESIKQLEDQIISMKKRVNDLSILKSSNNTIMNQKLSKVLEENETLRKEVEKLKGKKILQVEDNEKPMLFGSSQFD